MSVYVGAGTVACVFEESWMDNTADVTIPVDAGIAKARESRVRREVAGAPL